MPIPRGAAAKKRRVSDEDPIMAHRKLKKETISDGSSIYNPGRHRNASSGEFYFGGGTTELQDLAFSAQQALNQVPDDDTVPIDPALQSFEHHEKPRPDASAQASQEDAVMFSVEDSLNDAMEGVEAGMNPRQAPPVMEPISPGTDTNGFRVQINGTLEDIPSPQDDRNGIRFSPLTPNAQHSGWLGSTFGSRKPNHTQTPHRSNRQSNAPKTPSSRRCDSKDSTKAEPKSEPKIRATSSAIVDSEEDMASLALALQLQMEEHGLRRRSMV